MRFPHYFFFLSLTCAALQPAASEGLRNRGADETSVVLAKGRVKVSVDWRSQYSGQSGQASMRPYFEGGYRSDDAATFTFPATAALTPEIFVKVLDFGSNAPFLLFWGGLTDFEYTVTFENLDTGDRASFVKPAGQLSGGANTGALRWSPPEQRKITLTRTGDCGVTFTLTNRGVAADPIRLTGAKAEYLTEPGSDLVLTPQLAGDCALVLLSGCDSFDGLACKIFHAGSREIGVRTQLFDYSTMSLTKRGTGSGSVSIVPGTATGGEPAPGTPTLFRCTSLCSSLSLRYLRNAASMTAIARASPGSTFLGWKNCSHAEGATCTFTEVTASQGNIEAWFSANNEPENRPRVLGSSTAAASVQISP